MIADNPLTMQKYNESLLLLCEKLNQLEKRIAMLETPQLMYRPPKSEEYQSIAETLDYLHNTVEELKQWQE